VLGPGILLASGLGKSNPNLLMRHARMLGDTSKAPALTDRLSHRGDHRIIDHRYETRTQRDSKPQALCRSQAIEPIAEPRDVSAQKTDPRILIHLFRMLVET
jgi:hypothetical protein